MGAEHRFFRIVPEVFVLLLAPFLMAQSYPGETPVFGGTGGGPKKVTCPAGSFLTGVSARIGAWMDHIETWCAAPGPDGHWAGEPFHGPSPGMGSSTDSGWHTASCPRNSYVQGIYGMVYLYDSTSWQDADDLRNAYVAEAYFNCYHPGTKRLSSIAVTSPPHDSQDAHHYQWAGASACSGLATGVKGASGIYVDSLGLTCAPFALPAPAPAIPPAPAEPRVSLLPGSDIGAAGGSIAVRALVEWEPVGGEVESYLVQRSEGRSEWIEKERTDSKSVQASIPFEAGAEPSDDRRFLFRVCAANASGMSCSPGRTTWKPGPFERKRDRDPIWPAEVAAVGRVKGTAPPGPPMPICDAARAAHARESPAARGLETQCSALRALASDSAPAYADLAAKGEIVANGDPRFTALRDLQPTEPMRRGFHIAMAVAEGQTAWGPGKQKILDSLSAAEQEGFKVAVSLSLDRNRNAALANTGMAIAEADPSVAEARSGDPDVRYALGFDIASAIFGAPALGAQGNTATGPGSLGIRDGLSAAGQKGFNDGVAFHLSRKYLH